MSQTHFIIIRHGETHWNLEGRIQGFKNSPLTQNGIDQAQRLAKRLEHAPIDLLISSDLGRAVETAEEIAKIMQMEIIPEPAFRERNLGTIEGMTRTEVITQHGQQYYDHLFGGSKDIPADEPHPNGESHQDHFDRATQAIEHLAQAHPGKTIAIVTQGGTLNLLFRYVIGIPLGQPRHFSLLNTSIARLTHSPNNWRLESWGDIAHLETESKDDNSVPTLKV